MPNINKNIIMQAGAAVANATNKAAGISASTPEPGSIISAIQLVNGGRSIGPAALAHFTESVRNKLLSLQVDLEPIQSGSGTPSPDNVRPISGRTGLSVYRTGKNLYSRENSEYNVPYYNQDGTQTQYEDVAVWWFKAKPNTKYTCSLKEAPSSLTYFRWINCDTDKGFISRPASVYGSNQFPITITTPADTGWVQAAVNEYDAAQVASNDWQIQIEEGQTATAYEAFGNTYSVDWTSQAGTVYGGTLDVVTGVLTVDRASVDMGTLNWAYGSAYGGYFNSQDIKNLVADTYECLSDRFKNIPMSSTAITNNDWAVGINCNGAGGGITGAAAKGAVVATCKQYTDAATFKTAMSGVQLCYELATPLTYQLTGQDVVTLVGDNYIWSDSGDVTITE